MSSAANSPKPTNKAQKKVTIENQPKGSSPSKSPQKNSANKGSKSPSKNTTKSSKQQGSAGSGKKQSSDQKSPKKGIRKNSTKGKGAGQQQDKNNEDNKQQNQPFYDKDEVKQMMMSPRSLSNYWKYQDSTQRKLLEYKEKEYSNLLKVTDYNNKLHRLEEKIIDFDNVNKEIYSFRNLHKSLKIENDKFSTNNEDEEVQQENLQTQSLTNSPKKVKMSPSQIKLQSESYYPNEEINDLKEKVKIQEREIFKYQLQQQVMIEKILDEKLKNEKNNTLNNIEQEDQNSSLDKIASQYFTQKNKDQIQVDDTKPEAFNLQNNSQFTKIPSQKQIANEIELQPDHKTEFQTEQIKNNLGQIKSKTFYNRRNSISKNQNDRLNTFLNYKNKEKELNNLIEQPTSVCNTNRSMIQTPEDRDLFAIVQNDDKKYFPRSTSKNNDLSSEKSTNTQKYDNNKLASLQNKYLHDLKEYERFINQNSQNNSSLLNNEIKSLNPNNSPIKKYKPFSSIASEQQNGVPLNNEQNGVPLYESQYRRRSSSRMDTQQKDNQLRNRYGITEDLSSLQPRKNQKNRNNHFQRNEVNLDTNSSFLPDINENRRSLDFSFLNQPSKQNKNKEMLDTNLFSNSVRNSYQQRYAPTNKSYIHNKIFDVQI